MSRQQDKLAAFESKLEERLKNSAKTDAEEPDRGPRSFVGGLTKALLGSEEGNARLAAAREEGRLAVMLDPKTMRRSKFANRLPEGFADEDYMELKESIRRDGQQHAIKVRPITGDPDHQYEIACGQRRHQACLELGIPVLAIVKDMTDQELVRQMDIENAQRKDLSAWEDALQIRRWLDEGVYANRVQIAKATGRTQPYISLLLSALEIPERIVESFTDRRQIKSSWIQPLRHAIKENEERVTRVAQSIVALDPRPRADEVFRRLCAAAKQGKPNPTSVDAATQSRVVKHGRKKVLTISRNKKGTFVLKIDTQVPAALAEELIEQFGQDLVQRLSDAGVAK